GGGVWAGAAACRSVAVAGPRGVCRGGADPGAVPGQWEYDRAGGGGSRGLSPHRAAAARRGAGGGTAGGELSRYEGWVELREPGGAGQVVPGLHGADVGGVRVCTAGCYRTGTRGGSGAGRKLCAGAGSRLIRRRVA